MIRRGLLVVMAVLAAFCAPRPDVFNSARADDSPDAKKRAALADEPDAAALAAKIHALGAVDDPQTADVLLDVLVRPNELVRATSMVALLKMSNAECVERFRVHGLAHADGVVRAHAARACGKLRLASAKPALRTMIAADTFWLARSEAAIACGELGDAEAKPAIVKLLASDPSEKARLGAMDALGLLGPSAADAVPAIAENLKSERWQLRVGACEALVRIGSIEAVEPLVKRLYVEPSGRVGDEIYGALKSITGSDPGRTRENWWDWWEAEKAKKLKQPPPPPLGFAFSSLEVWANRIEFVVDTSASMEQPFDPGAAAAKSLAGTYSGATKLSICKEEIAQALAGLDPRSYFSILALGSTVRAFSNAPVPPYRKNVAAAVEWMRPLSGSGGADAFDGLRAALSLDEGPDVTPDFRNTPDTITLLTDDTPTLGAMSADALVEWFTALDRYARIRTHVIVLGADRGELDPLRAIATASGGRFTCLKARER